MKKLKFNGFSFSNLFIEIIAIIFSVLLALGLNELRQDYKDKELVETALKSINNEIKQNKNFLDSRIPYYNLMVERIDSLIQIHGSAVGFPKKSIPGFTGINPPLLRNSSLQTATSAEVFTNIDYELSDQIFWIYSFQETYLKWVYIYFDAFVNREEPTLKMLRNLFQEMAYVGGQVNNNYQKLLDELDNY